MNIETSVEQLCRRLLAASNLTDRDVLLAEAAQMPEALPHLLQTARERMGTETPYALQCAELAIALAERLGDRRGMAQAWRLVGQARRVRGDHAAAITALEAAADCALQATDGRLAAQVQIGQVDSLNWLGRHDEAIALANRLDAELRGCGEETDAAKVMVNLGSLHYRRDQYAQALSCYERALKTFADHGEAIAQATVQTNIAAVLMELHRVEEAISLFEAARAEFAAHSLPISAAKIDANVGFLHFLSGRYAQAVTVLKRAREEFSARDQTLDAAKCDADMADAYRELNLYPEAQEAYQRAGLELKSLGIDYEQARIELGLAAVCMANEQSEEAVLRLDRADRLFAAHRNSTQKARVGLLRSRLLRLQGDREGARSTAASAARTLHRSGVRGQAAEAKLLIAEMAGEDGRDVSRALHSILRTARETSRGWLECQAERALARHHMTRGNIKRGLRHQQASVEALEQARTLIEPEEMHVSFLRDKLAIYEETVGGLLRSGRAQDISLALEYVERAKSRLLLERVQAALEDRLAEESELPAHVLDRLTALRAELSRGYHRLNTVDESEERRIGSAGAEASVSLNILEQEYSGLLNRSNVEAHGGSGRFSLPSVVSAQQITDRLQYNEALLLYYSVSGVICVWIIVRGTVHFRSGFASMEEVHRLGRRLRYQLQRVGGGSELSERHTLRFQADMQAVLTEFYDLLLRPFADLLTMEQLIIVPHDALHGLPFHAFFDGEGHALDRWEISYSPSAALWHRGEERSHTEAGAAERWTDAEALLVSVPAPGIAQVTQEVTRLAQLLPRACVLQGPDATLAAVQAHAGKCRLLHLATHAFYRADNPLFSGLQLSDGWLLARDLYSMRLHCDLATLSACQTGVVLAEAGDELFGLVRGFLVSGARSVAASLWPADDQATAALMQEFYKSLFSGESKAAALRNAQQAIRRRFPHPYHWAAFVLIGERGRASKAPVCQFESNA